MTYRKDLHGFLRRFLSKTGSTRDFFLGGGGHSSEHGNPSRDILHQTEAANRPTIRGAERQAWLEMMTRVLHSGCVFINAAASPGSASGSGATMFQSLLCFVSTPTRLRFSPDLSLLFFLCLFGSGGRCRTLCMCCISQWIFLPSLSLLPQSTSKY